jgi:small subunit ribosomal protein S9
MTEAKKEKYYYGLGRRKESAARVRLYQGKGVSQINGEDVFTYFAKNEILSSQTLEPLQLTGNLDKFYFTVVVKGGGLSGQADATRLGLSRALVKYDEGLRLVLRKSGLLTRDQREKERKKYGLKRARKAPQFSKR